jgi:sec-independent protein translocase protein TatB
MLNVGPLELLVVLAVALIVVGPERLPELARSVGRAVRQLRQVQDEVRDMVASGIDDEARQAAAEFKKAAGDIARSAGVGDVVRKSGRAAGPGKEAAGRRTGTAQTATTARPDPSEAVSGPATDEPATNDPAVRQPPGSGSGAAQTPASPMGADIEGAGPPADRLVEDGAAPTVEPAGTDGAAEEPATER